MGINRFENWFSMRLRHYIFLLLIAALPCDAVESLQIEIPGQDQVLKLKGNSSRQQLLVSGKNEKGWIEDFTHKAKFESSPTGIVEIREGVVIPLTDGEAT